MQISNFSLPAIFCMCLYVPVTMAEGISVPDKSRREGMSYEEYSAYREKMRLQMEKNKTGDSQQKPAASTSPAIQPEKPAQEGAYGKGYHSRNPAGDRPDMGAGNRPDRPRAERFNRGDMGRR